MVVMGELRILGWNFRGELSLFVRFDMQFGVFQFQSHRTEMDSWPRVNILGLGNS